MSYDEDFHIERELGEALRVLRLICEKMGIDDTKNTESEEALDNDRY